MQTNFIIKNEIISWFQITGWFMPLFFFPFYSSYSATIFFFSFFRKLFQIPNWWEIGKSNPKYWRTIRNNRKNLSLWCFWALRQRLFWRIIHGWIRHCEEGVHTTKQSFFAYGRKSLHPVNVITMTDFIHSIWLVIK